MAGGGENLCCDSLLLTRQLPGSSPLSLLWGLAVSAFPRHRAENRGREKDNFLPYCVATWKVTKSTLLDPIPQSLQERLTDGASYP